MSRSRRCVAAALLGALLFGMTPATAADPYTAQIWNGTNVAAGEHRNVVVVVSAQGQCTGTIIARRWVLTAAHCLEGIPGQPVVVAGGGTTFAGGFEESFRTRVHAIHPRRNSGDAYDFGVIRLPRGSGIAPVALATAGDVAARTPATPATAVGWGTTDADGSGGRRLKQSATLLVHDAVCADDFPAYAGRVMVCADATVSSPCPGDSGGPLFADTVHGPVQIGVTSFGKRNCERGDGVAYGWTPAAAAWLQRVRAEGIERFRTTLVAGVSRERVRQGRRVGVGALLARRSDFAPLGLQRVRLYRRPAGSDRWRYVATRMTDADGFASLRHRPRVTTHYQWRHRAGRMTKPSRTPRITVEVVG